MGSLTRRPWAVLALLAMAGAHGMLRAAEPLEYAVKAAYLSKFPFYVEWPASAFTGLNSPITLCVAGEDPFGSALDEAVTGQQVQGHAIVVRRLRSVTRESGCHIVYIAGDARVEHLRGSNALVVTDGPSPGAIISFVLKDNKVRFNVDDDAAAQNGLTISSKLLSVALAVKPRGVR